VRYLFERKQGKSAALNYGINSTDCDVIGMIDDDEQLHPDWIGIVAKWLEDPQIDYLGGPYLGLWRTEKPDWIPPGYEGVLSADDPAQIPDTPLRFPDPRVFLRGGNAVLRRSVFDRIGAYRTDIGRFGNDLGSCEDHEIFARLLAAGLTGYYLPDLIIYHVVPPERVTREYYRKWTKGHAESLGVMDRTNRQKVPYLGRLPRYVIGDAVKALPALSSSDRARRFAAELRWWTLAGFVSGAYRKGPPANGNH
jgi:cellulose synthase/poly-beta-1,6-N-acetylglucosamine synthase-like glycosyltransferase